MLGGLKVSVEKFQTGWVSMWAAGFMPAIREPFGGYARQGTRSLRQEDVSTLIVELATGCEAPGLQNKN